MEECHKLLTDQVDDAILRYNISKPLPLGGDSGHVIIQMDFFFNKDLEYLWYSRKMGRPALSISKMKAAYYPDVGLEQMVPDQMAVRTHMRILSVVRIEVFPMYGYNYMKKIVLHRADLKEYVIAERDFKYLYHSDFEDLGQNLVIRKRRRTSAGDWSYQDAVKTSPKPLRWDAGIEYKHDFSVIGLSKSITLGINTGFDDLAVQ
ncbi:hypothetical protein Tco_1483030 [Tanacetum coccineum]